MLLATVEPGKEMAIANFFLAIFCIFTIFLPLLLITRGDKTEANRNFINATINPWSQVVKKADLPQVVISEITSSLDRETNLEVLYDQNVSPLTQTGELISLEIKGSFESDDSSCPISTTDDELLAA